MVERNYGCTAPQCKALSFDTLKAAIGHCREANCPTVGVVQGAYYHGVRDRKSDSTGECEANGSKKKKSRKERKGKKKEELAQPNAACGSPSSSPVLLDSGGAIPQCDDAAPSSEAPSAPLGQSPAPISTSVATIEESFMEKLTLEHGPAEVVGGPHPPDAAASPSTSQFAQEVSSSRRRRRKGKGAPALAPCPVQSNKEPPPVGDPTVSHTADTATKLGRGPQLSPESSNPKVNLPLGCEVAECTRRFKTLSAQEAHMASGYHDRLRGGTFREKRPPVSRPGRRAPRWIEGTGVAGGPSARGYTPEPRGPQEGLRDTFYEIESWDVDFFSQWE